MSESEIVKLLKERLKYDPETGKVYWTHFYKNHPRLFMKEAGTICDGRVVIRVKRKAYKRARVAFYLILGSCPSIVDHINGDTLDDRWENLRPANAFQNAWNTCAFKKDSNLPAGVRRLPSGNYQARVAAFKKTYHLGTFSTPDEAYEAYLSLKKYLHGEFFGRLKNAA